MRQRGPWARMNRHLHPAGDSHRYRSLAVGKNIRFRYLGGCRRQLPRPVGDRGNNDVYLRDLFDLAQKRPTDQLNRSHPYIDVAYK